MASKVRPCSDFTLAQWLNGVRVLNSPLYVESACRGAVDLLNYLSPFFSWLGPLFCARGSHSGWKRPQPADSHTRSRHSPSNLVSPCGKDVRFMCHVIVRGASLTVLSFCLLSYFLQQVYGQPRLEAFYIGR